MTKQNSQNLPLNKQLALIRKNRRALRMRGATSQTLQIVETYFSAKASKARIGAADVARILGIDPSQVRRQLKRAETMGLIVKIGRTYVLFARMILQTAQNAVYERVERMRERARKRITALKTGRKSRFREHVSSHIGQEYNLEAEKALLARKTKEQWQKSLSDSYIPLHLRAFKG